MFDVTRLTESFTARLSKKRALMVLTACGPLLWMDLPVRGEDGRKIFLKNCASCHGTDGKARTKAARKLGVKDLSISTATDDEIASSMWEGRKDDQGRSKMPSFKEKLSPEEIVTLVEFVKTFRQ